MSRSTLSVQATEATLGAIVTGVDLSAMTEAEWQTIERAFLELQALVIQGDLVPEALGKLLTELRKEEPQDEPFWKIYGGLHRIAGPEVGAGQQDCRLRGGVGRRRESQKGSDRKAARTARQ